MRLSTVREINAARNDAETRGANLYATGLKLAVKHNGHGCTAFLSVGQWIRVFRATTLASGIAVLAGHGNWYKVDADTQFDIR